MQPGHAGIPHRAALDGTRFASLDAFDTRLKTILTDIRGNSHFRAGMETGDGLPIGGTCVNVGCVPSETLIRTVEAHHWANHCGFRRDSIEQRRGRFAAVIAQKRRLVQQLRQAKYLDVVAGLPSVRIMPGRARFVSPQAVEVNGQNHRCRRFPYRHGAAPYAPPIPGVEDSGYRGPGFPPRE